METKTVTTPSTIVYAVSEIFNSPQGEALHSGTLMTFVRLAGCSVGKKYPTERYQETKETERLYGAGVGVSLERPVPGLPIWQEECTTWDGRKFACDTDYRVKERLSVEEILARVQKGVKHMCITGGEPMTRNLLPLYTGFMDLIDASYTGEPYVHIETSGTVPVPAWMVNECRDNLLWITVSPKFGVLKDQYFGQCGWANEVKLLVDGDFNITQAEELLEGYEGIVWLSAINDGPELNNPNMNKCKEIQLSHPTWRLMSQMHKIWGVQ